MLRGRPQGKISGRGSHEGVDASHSSADGQTEGKKRALLPHFDRNSFMSHQKDKSRS